LLCFLASFLLAALVATCMFRAHTRLGGMRTKANDDRRLARYNCRRVDDHFPRPFHFRHITCYHRIHPRLDPALPRHQTTVPGPANFRTCD
jgi:hypothetical protein